MNDLVLPGPNLMNRLDDVLLRFREGRLAVTGDIEAMYHMTYVYEQDRNMLRFLWSNGLNDSPEVYRMKVNIFGGVWSGAAAIFCLQECGKEAESESVRKSIMNSFYVDDWLQSADSEEEVQELVSGVRSCLKGGGFRLCKMTGSAEIVNCILDKKETLSLGTDHWVLCGILLLTALLSNVLRLVKVGWIQREVYCDILRDFTTLWVSFRPLFCKVDYFSRSLSRCMLVGVICFLMTW